MNTAYKFLPRLWLRAWTLCAALLMFTAGACMPEDTAVQPFDRGDAQSALITMGKDYDKRVYFDLSSNSAVKSIEFAQWHLEFACQPGNFQIRVNSAQFIGISNLGSVDMAAVRKSDVDATTYEFDTYSGDIDSLAVGQWWTQGDNSTVTSIGNVYAVDGGYSAVGTHLGYYKFRVLSIDDESYTIEYAELDSDVIKTATIKRDEQFNYLGFSFDDGSVIQHEPVNDTWDLVFTKYTYIFILPARLPYSVTGTLTNSNGAGAILETEFSFADVDRAYAASLEIGSREDAIGYEWKTFDFSDSNFRIEEGKTYIIRDTDGFLYKLRFIDFYDPISGDKGTPQFEYQRL